MITSDHKLITASCLPTPGIPLVLKLDDGTCIKGIRPDYVESYYTKDRGYRDMCGNVINNVKEWAIL